MAFDDQVRRMDAALIRSLGKPATDITYQPAATDAPVGVAGIFDEAYVLVDVGEAGVASTAPAVFFRLADLLVDPDDADDLLITIDGVAYVKREPPKKDGQGGVWIVLRRSA